MMETRFTCDSEPDDCVTVCGNEEGNVVVGFVKGGDGHMSSWVELSQADAKAFAEAVLATMRVDGE